MHLDIYIAVDMTECSHHLASKLAKLESLRKIKFPFYSYNYQTSSVTSLDILICSSIQAFMRTFYLLSRFMLC